MSIASTLMRPASSFPRQGFVAAGPVMSVAQRALLLDHLKFGAGINPATWSKGHAVTDRLLYDFASSPSLLDILRPLLGEDIILWGAIALERQPNEVHPWHVDIESSASDQRFASIWIGLQNTSRESGLSFLSGSHLFPMTIQEVQQAKQVRRGGADDATVLGWAKELDPQAEILQPDVSDGEAIVFDGQIWHGSCNRCNAGTRRALLLQYSSAEAPVLMPDPSALEWPFKFNRLERPPVIVVSGSGNGGGNRQVPPPPTSPKGATVIDAEARLITLPLAENRKSGWQAHPLFNGVTGVHDHISCHASVLGPGKIPHPPHNHLEEEILIVLDGDAELLLGDGPDIEAATAHPAQSGMFAYYPAYRYHTLRNCGSRPLTYLMFKWRGPPIGAETVLATQIIDTAGRALESPEPFRTALLFEGPTNLLGKLHVHLSEVEPGGGYAPHRDEHDVAIVVLSGAIESLGQIVEPFGVVYYAAGERHGLRGTGGETARYLVFEFHGDQSDGRPREKTCGVIPYQRRWLYRQAQQISEALPAVGRAVPRPVKNFVKYVLD